MFGSGEVIEVMSSASSRLLHRLLELLMLSVGREAEFERNTEPGGDSFGEIDPPGEVRTGGGVLGSGVIGDRLLTLFFIFNYGDYSQFLI